MEPILELQGVGVTYDGRPALADVTLAVPRNRITAIIGASGCGKTTLLRSINRMIDEEPAAKVNGRILLDGTDVRSMGADELRRRVGLVFQTPAPFPFSIYKNMTFALRYLGNRPGELLDRIVREKLEMAGLYEEVRDCLGSRATTLSGGQQQRLCIARALTVEPEVLLLDEPCSALDIRSIAAIEAMLTELKRTYSIVLVTHNIAQARRIADCAAHIDQGRVVEFGERDQVLLHPLNPETRAFLSGACG